MEILTKEKLSEFIERIGLKLVDNKIDLSSTGIDLDSKKDEYTRFGTSGFRIKGVKINKNDATGESEIIFNVFTVMQELAYVSAACSLTKEFCNAQNSPLTVFICGDGLRPFQEEFLQLYSSIVSSHGLIPYFQKDADASITSVAVAHDVLIFPEITSTLYRSCSHNPPTYLGAKYYLNKDPSPILGKDGTILFNEMQKIILEEKNIPIDLEFGNKIKYIDAYSANRKQTQKMIDIAMPDFKESLLKLINTPIVIALNGGHTAEIEALLKQYLGEDGEFNDIFHFIEERELILNSDPTSKDSKKSKKYQDTCDKWGARILIATDSDQDRPILYVRNPQDNMITQITSNEILNLAIIEIGKNNDMLVPVHTHPTLGAYQSSVKNHPYLSGVGYLFISILFKKMLGIEVDQSRKEEAIILDHNFNQLKLEDINELGDKQFAIAIEESGGAQLVSKLLDFNSFDKNGLFTLAMIFYTVSKLDDIFKASINLPQFSDRDSIELVMVEDGKKLIKHMATLDSFLGFELSTILNKKKKPICIVLKSDEMTIQLRASGTEPIVRLYFIGNREIVVDYLSSKKITNAVIELLESI